jgi:predicted nucleic acid-binding protein
MKTAIDTNVLLDLFGAEPTFFAPAQAALMQADAKGDLLICDLVYAELSGKFLSQSALDQKLAELGIEVIPLPRTAAFQAGLARERYLRAGGKRVRILPDFLVAAHAAATADRLLTRDDGFYRTYFPKLKIFDPTAGR